MKAFSIYIKEYDWAAKVFIAVSHLDTQQVCRELAYIGCRGFDIEQAERQIARGALNTGICYSNSRERSSVMVIGITSSAKEFLNSLVHETGHMAIHIATAAGIELRSEEVCYIMGDIAGQIYPEAKGLLCQHCREHK